METNLPVYECIINESLENELQVEKISFVDKPAIEKNFMAFNEARLRFSVDDEKRIVSGPAMLADMMIYRNDPLMGEYYTVFRKDTILSIVQKYFKQGYENKVNLMHSEDVNGVTVYESYIVDRALGKNPMKGYEDAADGSWFVSMKVDNEGVWEKVKSGELKGFSVEGIFKQIPVTPQKMSAEMFLEALQRLLSQVE